MHTVYKCILTQWRSQWSKPQCNIQKYCLHHSSIWCFGSYNHGSHRFVPTEDGFLLLLPLLQPCWRHAPLPFHCLICIPPLCGIGSEAPPCQQRNAVAFPHNGLSVFSAILEKVTTSSGLPATETHCSIEDCLSRSANFKPPKLFKRPSSIYLERSLKCLKSYFKWGTK